VGGGRTVGGSVPGDWPRLLGTAAALGLSPVDLLRADPAEREVLLAALPYAREFAEARDEALARRIVNDLAESMKRGR
jgi:hypothetical protein